MPIDIARMRRKSEIKEPSNAQYQRLHEMINHEKKISSIELINQ